MTLKFSRRRKLFLLITLIWLTSCSHQKIKIGIQPYANVDSAIIDTIAKALKNAYHAEVIILVKRALPENAFINIKSARYRADSLLRDLIKNKPDSIDYIIGLTSNDISTTKRDNQGRVKQPFSKYTDWGVFGLGFMPGKSCVISTFRLKNNKSLLLNRIKKISIHEIGHNYGLHHCSSKKCVMQDAVERISTVDACNMEFCEKCKKKLKR